MFDTNYLCFPLICIYAYDTISFSHCILIDIVVCILFSVYFMVIEWALEKS